MPFSLLSILSLWLAIRSSFLIKLEHKFFVLDESSENKQSRFWRFSSRRHPCLHCTYSMSNSRMQMSENLSWHVKIRGSCYQNNNFRLFFFKLCGTIRRCCHLASSRNYPHGEEIFLQLLTKSFSSNQDVAEAFTRCFAQFFINIDITSQTSSNEKVVHILPFILNTTQLETETSNSTIRAILLLRFISILFVTF